MIKYLRAEPEILNLPDGQNGAVVELWNSVWLMEQFAFIWRILDYIWWNEYLQENKIENKLLIV